jgi:hypothetical protein
MLSSQLPRRSTVLGHDMEITKDGVDNGCTVRIGSGTPCRSDNSWIFTQSFRRGPRFDVIVMSSERTLPSIRTGPGDPDNCTAHFSPGK